MHAPLILFGAFDRHNLGDLLFPHVAAALLPGRPLRMAGLAARDLRGHGGHAVEALAALCRAGHGPPTAQLLHVGGETLTCSAWQAAVMLLPPEEAPSTLAYFDAHPGERAAWVHGMLGTDAPAPYVVSPRRCPMLAGVRHAGVGGAALDAAEPALRREVLADLAAADTIGVRDGRTLAHLAAAGLAARLMPDPATLAAELFGPRIAAVARDGPVAAMHAAFPHGYLAVQVAAEFGDDTTLQSIAMQLGRAARADDLGIALFRAGAAPWHDDLAVLHRLAGRLRPGRARVFESLDLWDLCALVAGSRGYCGSSLHGRILAMAYALPRVNLHPPRTADAGTSKHAAYAATWEAPGMPGVVAADEIADALDTARAVSASVREETARDLAAHCHAGWAEVCDGLE